MISSEDPKHFSSKYSVKFNCLQFDLSHLRLSMKYIHSSLKGRPFSRGILQRSNVHTAFFLSVAARVYQFINTAFELTNRSSSYVETIDV